MIRTSVLWSDRFAYTNLKKGEKAVYLPVLLSQRDERLLDMAAHRAGLKRGVLASRLLSQVLELNRHQFEGNQ
jgi:hypothetical protein